MIKNEKQYRITKAQVRRFQDALAEFAGQERPSNIAPRLWEAQRQAARSQMEELQEQVEAYERLNLGQSKAVVLEAVEDLPKALIRAPHRIGNDAGRPRAPLGGEGATGAALRSD